MYVQEIIIDGFKSYAKRTVIEGFDPMFNAITGLNGSGKSNILDSICFVLGISRLEQVRAGSLQELVYKQGQAGVTRATVTVVFNNKDKNQSPVGYEAYDEIAVCRQVAIGGRNKYLINGHLAQQNRVQNLFHSVQLNINNPHFLIMQGRITKVINMSPIELLGLIAEAAGTKMYEAKKDAALKTIEKKQAKVEEIHKILAEDITPSLEKLRKERAQYMQWSAGNSECERLQRFCTAWDFCQAEAVTKKSAEEMVAMQQEKSRLTQTCSRAEEDISEKEEEIKAMQRTKDQDMGNDIKRLEQQSTDLSKVLVRDTSAWQHKKEALEGEKKSASKMMKNMSDLQKVQDSNKSKVEKASSAITAISQELTQSTEKLADLQRQRQALQAGCDADCAEGDKSLAEQLKDAKTKVITCETELKQLQMKVDHYRAELAGKQKGAKTAGKEYTSLQAEHSKATAAVERHREDLSQLSFDPAAQEELQKNISKELKIVHELREAVDALNAQVANYEVKYQAPYPGFDNSKVKGIVASLVQLKQPETATALEVACGAKLFQLVVSDEVTGKDILSKGQLKKRVTIIPLNKIDGAIVSDSAIRNAHRAVGPARANLALELVGFEPEVDAAMRYVFGKTIVCKDVEAAKTCAFTEGIRVRSVTLEGDLFDPAGTLTGGSRAAASNSILARFAELAERQSELSGHEQSLAAMQQELQKTKSTADRHASICQKLALAEHELNLVNGRLQSNPYFKAAEELKNMELEVSKSEQAIVEKGREKKETEAKVVSLEKQVREYSSMRDKHMGAKEKEIADIQKRITDLQQKLKATREQNENILLESETNMTEMASLQEQIASAESAVEKASAEVAEAEGTVAKSKAEFELAEGSLANKRAELKQADKQIAAACKECEKLQTKLAEDRLAIKKIEHSIARFEKDTADAHRLVDNMLRQHGWIQTERQFFGKRNSDYDFEATDPAKAQQRLQKLGDEQEKLGKKINKKVMGMFEKAEQEYQEVVNKKRIIENDKRKIEAVITELDEKKNQALKTTWAKVNRDFSSIFTTLLPNAKAKLDPPEGGTVLDGLVLRVGFGDCWKDSLSELSGGQRSLLALSLILSLLLFKPAPMYILDEIDAALDLSHTQNIGNMLRTHFKKSQFIVVSLKEGMFNNANVLFRTKFVDGVSTVARTTPGQR